MSHKCCRMTGNGLFILKTSSIHSPADCSTKGKKKNSSLSPLRTPVKRKKNEEMLFLASPPPLICIPVFLEKEAHDWRMKCGGGAVVSGNLRARHQPHKTTAITADALVFRRGRGGPDGCRRQRAGVKGQTAADVLPSPSGNKPTWGLPAPRPGSAVLSLPGRVQRMSVYCVSTYEISSISACIFDHFSRYSLWSTQIWGIIFHRSHKLCCVSCLEFCRDNLWSG